MRPRRAAMIDEYAEETLSHADGLQELLRRHAPAIWDEQQADASDEDDAPVRLEHYDW